MSYEKWIHFNKKMIILNSFNHFRNLFIVFGFEFLQFLINKINSSWIGKFKAGRNKLTVDERICVFAFKELLHQIDLLNLLLNSLCKRNQIINIIHRIWHFSSLTVFILSLFLLIKPNEVLINERKCL